MKLGTPFGAFLDPVADKVTMRAQCLNLFAYVRVMILILMDANIFKILRLYRVKSYWL